MGLACRITGHKWHKLPDGKDGCTCTRCGTVRNKDHSFALSAEDGLLRCTVCGIGIDESRAQAVIEAFKEKPEGYWSFAYDLIQQIEDPACIVSVAPLMPRQAFERLGQLGADVELEAIACGTAVGMRRGNSFRIRDRVGGEY